jgi:asparagine synthase (glutamine-hydrolysing)
VQASLEAAVHKRLLAERPVAALLSGGLDSSLIAGLVQQSMKARGRCLETFSIGMAGSTDLRFAGYVAGWIGSKHHEIVVTADEMFAAIPSVIRAIESYDITTVRASVGNWMVARAVRSQSDCKVVFNGDGSDEVWGSYLYMGRAPSGAAFERESERLLEEIHQYDVLRSDRCLAAHGLEARTPFLDKQFVGVARSAPTGLRRWSAKRLPEGCSGSGQVEKQLLREAFAQTGLLPGDVMWRKKEAFSDGVSGTERSWFEEIQTRVSGLVPADWETQAARWTPRPPTAEAFWYRSLYEEYYGSLAKPWPYWMPRWSPETKDPSARTLAPASSALGMQAPGL